MVYTTFKEYYGWHSQNVDKPLNSKYRITSSILLSHLYTAKKDRIWEISIRISPLTEH